jgi:hypothetical protein
MQQLLTPGLGKRGRRFIASLGGLCLGAGWVSAQIIVFGTAAETQFQQFKIDHSLNLIDFESVAIGPLETQLQGSLGITFQSTTTTSGSILSPFHNAYVSSASVNGDNSRKLVGTPFASFGTDDGRVGYQITFDTPQSTVGMLRNWNTGAVTHFYNSQGTLLGSHTNTTGLEFVGWIGSISDPLTWVARVEFDGNLISGVRQVGYVDNIYFGFTPIPEPSTWLLLGGGLLLLLAQHRRRGHAVKT